MDDYDPACPTEDESQLMELDLSQVPLPPTLPTQSKTRSRNFSKQISPTSDKEDDKKGKKKKRKKKRHGRGQDGGEEEKEEEAPIITEAIHETAADLLHKIENVPEREDKPHTSATSSSQLPGDQVKVDTPSAPLSSDATAQAASISSRSSGRLQFKLAADPTSGKAKVLFQLNKPLKVSALRVASEEEEEKEEVVEEEEKQIIEKTAAGEYVPTRFKVSKKHEMYKPNLLGPGLTVVFNSPSIGMAMGSAQPGNVNSGGSSQLATGSKDVDGNSRGDFRKTNDEVRKKKEDDEGQALPLRRSERRRSRDTKEQDREKESESGSRAGRFDRSLDRRDDSRGTRSSFSRSQKDAGKRRDSGDTGRRGKVDAVQERRRSSRFQKDEEERKDKDTEGSSGARRHQHRRQDSSVEDRRTRNARRSRSGSRDRKHKSPSRSPRRSTAKLEMAGQDEDKSGLAACQAIGSPPCTRLQEPSPPRGEENTKPEAVDKSALVVDPWSPVPQHSNVLDPSSEGNQVANVLDPSSEGNKVANVLDPSSEGNQVEEFARVEEEGVAGKPVQDDITVTRSDATVQDGISLTKSDATVLDDINVTKSDATLLDDITVTKSDAFVLDDINVTKSDATVQDDINVTKIDVTEQDGISLTKIDATVQDDISLKKSDATGQDSIIVTKSDATLKLESSDSEGAAKKTVQKLVIRRSFDTNDFQVTRNDLADAEDSEKVHLGDSGSVIKTQVKDSTSSPKKRMKSSQGQSPAAADVDVERETRGRNSVSNAGRRRKEKKDWISTSRRESLRRQRSNSSESDEGHKGKVTSGSKKSSGRHETARGRPSGFRVDEPALPPEQVLVDVSAIPGKSKWEMEDEEEEMEPVEDAYKSTIYGNYRAEQQKPPVAKAYEALQVSWRRSARLQTDATKKSTLVKSKARESSSNEDDLSQDRHKGKEKKRHGHKSKAEKKTRRKKKRHEGGSSTEEQMELGEKRKSKRDSDENQEEDRKLVEAKRKEASIKAKSGIDTAKLVTYLKEYSEKEEFVVKEEAPKAKAELDNSKIVSYLKEYSEMMTTDQEKATKSDRDGMSTTGQEDKDGSREANVQSSEMTELNVVPDSEKPETSVMAEDSQFNTTIEQQDGESMISINKEILVPSNSNLLEGGKTEGGNIEEAGPHTDKRRSVSKERSERADSKSSMRSREREGRSRTPEKGKDKRERSKSTERTREKERSKSLEIIREKGDRSESPVRNRSKRNKSKSIERIRDRRERSKSIEKTREKRERSKSTERSRDKRERSKSPERSRDKRERSKSPERSRDKRDRSKSPERSRDKRERSKSTERSRDKRERSKSTERSKDKRERSKSTERSRDKRERSKSTERSRDKRDRSKSPERSRDKRDRSRSVDRNRRNLRSKSPKQHERSRSTDRRLNRRSRSPYFRSRGRRNRSKSGSPERKDRDRKNRSRSKSFERGRFVRRHRSPGRDMYGRGRRERDRRGRSRSDSRDRNLDLKKHGVVVEKPSGRMASSPNNREKEDIGKTDGKIICSTDAEFLTANIDLSTIPIPGEIPLPGEVVVKNELAVTVETPAPIDANVDDESMEISDEDGGKEKEADKDGEQQGQSKDDVVAASQPEAMATYVNPATLSAGKDRQIKFSIVGSGRKLKPAGMLGLLDDLAEPGSKAMVPTDADAGQVDDAGEPSSREDFQNDVGGLPNREEERNNSHSLLLGNMGRPDSVDVPPVLTQDRHEASQTVLIKEEDIQSDNFKPQIAEQEENKQMLVPEREAQKDISSIVVAQPTEKPRAADGVVTLSSGWDEEDETDVPSVTAKPKVDKHKPAPAPQRLKFKYVPLWEMEETEKRPVIEVSAQKPQSTISLALDYGSGSSDYEDENGSPVKRKSPARSSEKTPVKLAGFETCEVAEIGVNKSGETDVDAYVIAGEKSLIPEHASNVEATEEMPRSDSGSTVETFTDHRQGRSRSSNLQDESKMSQPNDKSKISLQDNLDITSLPDKSNISSLQDKTKISSLQDTFEILAKQDKSERSTLQDKSERSTLQDQSERSTLQDKSEKSTLQDKSVVLSHQVSSETSSCEKVLSPQVEDQEAYSPSHPSLEDADDSTDLPAIIPYSAASKHKTENTESGHGQADAVTSGTTGILFPASSIITTFTPSVNVLPVDSSVISTPYSVSASRPVSALVGGTPSKDLPYVTYPHIPLPLVASPHSSGIIQPVQPPSILLPSLDASKVVLPSVGVAPVQLPGVVPVPPPTVAPVPPPSVAPVPPSTATLVTSSPIAPIQAGVPSAGLLPVTYPTLPFPGSAPKPVPPPQFLVQPPVPSSQPVGSQHSTGLVSSVGRQSASQAMSGLQGIPLPGMVMPPLKAFQPVPPPGVTGVLPVPLPAITGVLPVPLPAITGVLPVPPPAIAVAQPPVTAGIQPQLITSFPVLTSPLLAQTTPLLAQTTPTNGPELTSDPSLTQQPPVKFRINRFHQGPAGVVPQVIPPPTVSIPTLSVATGLASELSSQAILTTSYPSISVKSLAHASPTSTAVKPRPMQKLTKENDHTAGGAPSKRPKISSILSQPKIEDPKLLEMLVKSDSEIKSLTGSLTLAMGLPETLTRDIQKATHHSKGDSQLSDLPKNNLEQQSESTSPKSHVVKEYDSNEKTSSPSAQENVCPPPQAAVDGKENSGFPDVPAPEKPMDKTLLFAENIDFDMDSIPLPAGPPLPVSVVALLDPKLVDVGQGISLPREPPIPKPATHLPTQTDIPPTPTMQPPTPTTQPPTPTTQPPTPMTQPLTAQPPMPNGEVQTQPPLPPPPSVITDSSPLPPLPPSPMSPKSQTLGSLLAERKKRFSQSPLAIGMLPKVPLTQSPLAIGPLPKLPPEPEISPADGDISSKKSVLMQDIKKALITTDARKGVETKTKEPLQLVTGARPKIATDKEEPKSSVPGLSKIHIVLKSKSAVQRTLVRGFEDEEGSDSDNVSEEPRLEPLPDAESGIFSTFAGDKDEPLPPSPYAGGEGVLKEEALSKQGQVRSKFVALSDIEAFPVQVITSSRKEEDTPASSWPEFTVGKRREEDGGKDEKRKAGKSDGRERDRKKERRNSMEDDRTPTRDEHRKKIGDDEEERRESRRKRDDDSGKRREGDYEESGGRKQVKKEKEDEGYNDRRDDRRSSRGDDRQRGRYDDRGDDSYSRRRKKDDDEDYGKRRGKDDGRRRSRGDKDDDRKRSKYDDSRSGNKYSERDRSRERSRDRSPDREKGKRSFGKRNKRSRERSRSRSPPRKRDRERSRDGYDRRERDKSRSRSDSRERKPRDGRNFSSKKKDSRSFKEDFLDEYSKSSSSVDVQEDIFKVTTIGSSYGPSYPQDPGHYTADPNYPSVTDQSLYSAPQPTSVDVQAAYSDPSYGGQYPPSYEHQQYGPAWQGQQGHDVYAQDMTGQYQDVAGQYQPQAPDHSAPPPHQYPFHQPQHQHYPQQPVYHAGPYHLPPSMPPQQLPLPHLQQPGGVQPPHIPLDQNAQSGTGHFISTQQHIPSYNHSAPPPTHLQPQPSAHFGHSDSQFHLHSGAIRGPILPPPRTPLLQTPSIPRNVMETPSNFGSPRFTSPDIRSSPGFLKQTEVKAVRKSRFSPADPLSLKAVVSTSIDLQVSGPSTASAGVADTLQRKPFVPEPSFETSSLAEVEFDTTEKQDGRAKSRKKPTSAMAEDVNEPTVSSSGVEDTAGDTGSDSGTESSQKPLKVKSRWRRNSEAEAVVDTSTPPQTSAPTPALTVGLSGQQGSTSSPTLESSPKEMRRTRSRAAAEELGGGTPSIETPPPPPPLRKRIKLDMAGAEDKADEDSRSDEDVGNEGESPQDLASIIKRPDFPRFEIILENIHLTERKRSKSMKRMLCDCTTSREDRAMGIEACGSDCLNRMLMIECGARCPCGEYCTNRRFQKKIYSKTLPFSAGDKGWGLRAEEDMEEKGTFIMEYVGELLDYEEFVRRTKQYSKAGLKHHYFMALNADEVVDATLRGNISRFINHSCDPNCETQKWTVNGELRVGFFTRKEIKKGEELTFDYQFEHYGEPQKCYCGADNCRGYIGLVKSPTKNNKRKERKKREIFKDELLEEDIEKLSMLDGMRNKNHVLELCRLMVRAEKVQHRIAILKILQETTETACLRLFLDYHGLPLYWSWMADIGTADYSEDTQELKLLMLSVLKCLPITNRTVLKESKILDIVERWAVAAVAAARKPPPPPPPTSTTTSIPSLPQPMADSADVAPEVVLGDNEADATFETAASGAAAEPEPSASSSETTPPSSPTPPPPIPISNVTPVSILASAKETKEAKQKRRVTFAEVHVETAFSPEPDEDMEENDDISSSTQYSEESRDEAMSQEGVSLLKSELPGEATPIGNRNIGALDLDLSSNAADSTSQKDAFDSSGGDCTGLSSDTDNSDTESVIKDPLASLAAECMSQWSSLKEVFKIPKKERVEERKRTEMELGSPKTDDVLSKKQPETSDPYAKWKRGRSRAFVRKKLPEDEERKSNLPRMTKEERRQRFEARVKAEDEMAAQAAAEEYQRQQEAYILHQQRLLEDPTYFYNYMQQQGDFAVMDPNIIAQEGMIDPVTGQPIPPEVLIDPQTGQHFIDPSGQHIIDPNTGQPLVHVDPNTGQPLLQIDPNTGQPLLQIDPNTGQQFLQIDPNTGQPLLQIDPNTGQPLLQIDPNTGQHMVHHQIDPQTGQPIDPLTGQPIHHIDLHTGQPIDPSTGQPIDPSAGQHIQQLVPHSGQQQVATPMDQQMVQSMAHHIIDPQTVQPISDDSMVDPHTGHLIKHSVLSYPAQSLPNISHHQTEFTSQPKTQHMPKTASNISLSELDMEEEVPPPPSPPTIPVTKLPPNWKTAKDNEGRVYYYHAFTRQTQWEMPSWDEDEDSANDMDLDPLPPEEIIRQSKKKTTTAAADTSSEVARKIKDSFRIKMSDHIILYLNPYRKKDCKIGRISSTDDFKHLARKLTHHVMSKELKHCRHVEDLEVNENVKAKAKDYVRKYMSKFGTNYKKSSSPQPD